MQSVQHKSKIDHFNPTGTCFCFSHRDVTCKWSLSDDDPGDDLCSLRCGHWWRWWSCLSQGPEETVSSVGLSTASGPASVAPARPPEALIGRGWSRDLSTGRWLALDSWGWQGCSELWAQCAIAQLRLSGVTTLRSPQHSTSLHQQQHNTFTFPFQLPPVLESIISPPLIFPEHSSSNTGSSQHNPNVWKLALIVITLHFIWNRTTKRRARLLNNLWIWSFCAGGGNMGSSEDENRQQEWR